MKHQKGAFFSEHEADDTGGFAIIEVDENSEQYRVAEKWIDKDGDERWGTYWVSEEALADRMDAGHCSYKQQLSDKQFEGILNLANVAYQYQKAVA